MSNEPTTFRSTLKKLMDERNHTAADIARFAGVRRNTVYYWLEGAIPRDLKPISKLASELNVSFHYLLLGHAEPNAAPVLDSKKSLERVVLDGQFRITIESTGPSSLKR